MSAIPDYVLLMWEQELFTARGDRQQSQLEWLGSAPHKTLHRRIGRCRCETADSTKTLCTDHCLTAPRLECAEGSSIDWLLTWWKRRQLTKEKPVINDQIDVVPPRWRDHVCQSDTKSAGAAFDCVVLTELRCGLRNGSVWAPESLSFLQQRLDALGSGLAGVTEAVERSSLVIDERGLHVKNLHALDEDRLLDRARNR